eukprot:GDKK01047893.1.p1 GENE.GDKK01047893.1~~GDKK01047893.1.p1  ORF type:complete len:557 (-),score=168.89 GDKK01047893.1:1035-2468(-)
MADLMSKSRHTAAKVADNLKQCMPASVNDKLAEVESKVAEVNEKVAQKVSTVFAKIHSTTAPESLKEFQVQLMGLYHQVMASDNMTEIRATLTDSSDQPIPVRVRRVSEVAAVVSIRNLTALVDFAEQKINILFPSELDITQENVSSSKAVVKVESWLYDRVSSLSDLPRRVISLPLNFTFRLLRVVDLRSKDLINMLETATRNRMETLSHNHPSVKKMSKIYANLKEHAEEHVQVQILKENAKFYAQRLVQLRRDIVETFASRLPQIKADQLRQYFKTLLDYPQEVVSKIEVMLLAYVASLKGVSQRIVELINSLRDGLLQHELVLVALNKKNEIVQNVVDKKSDLTDKYKQVYHSVFSSLSSRRDEVLLKKNEVLSAVCSRKMMVLAKKNELLTELSAKKDSMISCAVEKKENLILNVQQKKEDVLNQVQEKKATLTNLANEKMEILAKSHPVVAENVKFLASKALEAVKLFNQA